MQFDIEERKAQGRQSARVRHATLPKEFGQTSPEVYPYTYWWIVGYNEVVNSG